MSSEDELTNASQISTDGGPAIGGDINTSGGDFVGRDKNIFAEEAAYNVHGLGNPYLGLRAFTYDDRAIYAGREQLAQETVQQLTAPGAQPTLLFITGASGSGKSSFAQAALIPLLETHYAAYQKTVRLAVFRPSSQPMAMLADALQKLHPDLTPATLTANTPKEQINLLLIDQFEELFIQPDASQRAPFCDFLTSLPSFAAGRTHILLTLRVDYLDELFTIQPLWAIAKAGVELRTMRADDLRNAIQKPLQVKHPQKRFAPELLDRLVQDAGADAALLPLLQVTLAELWKTGRLVLANYHSLTNAIRQRAEAVYTFHDFDKTDPKVKRPTDEQAELMAILLDLINVSVDGDDRRDVRQRRTRHELAHGSLYRPRLIEELVNARLLAATSETRNGETVEVIDIIHESLIDNWDRLRQAIEAQRQQLQRRARFKLWLGEWLQHERNVDYLLLTNVQLADAQALNEQNDIELRDPTARKFYRQSVEHQETEQRRQLEAAEQRAREAQERERAQRRTATRLRLLVWGLGFVTLMAMLIAVFAFYQTRLATGASLVFQARNFAHDGNLRLATLLALEAQPLDPIQSARVLEQEIPFQIPFTRFKQLQDHGPGFYGASVVWSPDGQQIASASRLGDKIVLWDAKNGTQVRTLPIPYAIVGSVAWRPDGQQIAAGVDHDIIIWDAKSWALVHTLRGDRANVNSVAWSPDGQQLAAGAQDGTIIVWDAKNGTQVRILPEQNSDSIYKATGVTSVAWSPDGQQLAIASSFKTLIVWDVKNGVPVHTLSSDVYSVAWSPDGRQLASAGLDNRMVIVWDVKSGTQVRTLQGNATSFHSVAWSPDGQEIAAGANYKTIIVWGAKSGTQVRTLQDPSGLSAYRNVTSVAWSPDGQQLASGADDDTIIVWEAKSRLPVRALQGHRDGVKSVTWSPNGQQFASRSDNTIMIWDANSGIPVHTLQHHNLNVMWSPDGQPFAWGVSYGNIILWDAKNGAKARTLPSDFLDSVSSVTWSPDGQQIAAALYQDGRLDHGTIMIWDTKSETNTRTLQGYSRSGDSSDDNVAWRPDGQLIAAESHDNLILWDVKSGAQVRALQGGSLGIVSSMAWSPNGQQLAAGFSYDDKIIIWDTKSGRQVRTLPSHWGWVSIVAWSPNGQQLAAGAEDGTITAWNTKNGMLMSTIRGHSAAIHSVAWSPDGQWLASGSDDRTIVVYPREYLQSPCTWAGSNLTLDEWSEYRGMTLYRPTCPDYPSPPVPGAIEFYLILLLGLLLNLLFSIGVLWLVIAVLLLWGCFWLVRRLIRKRRQRHKLVIGDHA